MRLGVYVDLPPEPSLAGADLPPAQEPRVYTAAEFRELTERKPQCDDLDRLNCPEAGLPGHLQCGACIVHQMPRFLCGCVALIGGAKDHLPAVRAVTDVEWDPSRVAVDMERILGWPELTAFPRVVERLRAHKGEVNEPALRHAMEKEVCLLLHELAERGALFRDGRGIWRYDGRGR